MTRCLLALLCVVVTPAVLAQQATRDTRQQPPRGSAVIAGVITTTELNPRPVRSARVTLNSEVRDIPGRTATTDDAGRFAFRDLPAGRYNLQATKSGYLGANYGARRPDRPGNPVTVIDGQQITGVQMTLVRGGVLTGVVVDESGQPLPGAVVSVMRFSYSSLSGERMLGYPSYSAGGGLTDDRGVWRAWGLPPGEYLVTVGVPGFRNEPGPGMQEIRRLSAGDVDRAIAFARTGRGGLISNPASPDATLQSAGEPMQYAPVFYPGTTDLARATTITIGVGEERSGVDVAFRRVPTARIQGTVRLLDGVSPQEITIALEAGGSQSGLWESIGVREVTVPLQPDATFTFVGVAPGTYAIKARGADFGLPASSPARSAWARADVTIEGRNENVTLELRPGMTIDGRFVFDGATPPPKDAGGARVFLTPAGAGANLSAGLEGGTTDAEGRFAFSRVTPATYRMSWSRPDALRGWDVRSAIANGRDVLDHGLTIVPGANVTLTITFTDRPAELSGTLQSASGVPAPDYFIIIFATDRALWLPGSRRIRMARPGTDGRYIAPNLAPGEYFVAALTDVESGEWNDRSFLEALVPAAIRVTVGEGERKVQNLQIR